MIEDEIAIVKGHDTGEGTWSQHLELLRKVVFKRENEHRVYCVANVERFDADNPFEQFS